MGRGAGGLGGQMYRARQETASGGGPCRASFSGRLRYPISTQNGPIGPAINPNGWIPVLVGDEAIYEAAAITIYLCDKYPSAKLAPIASAVWR